MLRLCTCWPFFLGDSFLLISIYQHSVLASKPSSVTCSVIISVKCLGRVTYPLLFLHETWCDAIVPFNTLHIFFWNEKALIFELRIIISQCTSLINTLTNEHFLSLFLKYVLSTLNISELFLGHILNWYLTPKYGIGTLFLIIYVLFLTVWGLFGFGDLPTCIKMIITIARSWLCTRFSPVYQFSSVSQLCLTLCDPIDCSMPGFPALHQLTELTQTHVHPCPVSDAIQRSHPLLSPSPPTFNLSQHQGLFQ